jgi:PAS domain S-box-containing protein
VSSHRPPSRLRALRGGEPLLVFVISLLVTGMLVVNIAESIRVQDRTAFENEVARTIDAITSRIDTTITLLRGTVGLFDASEVVDRHEFRAYVDSLDLRRQYPGILGIGFSRYVAPDGIAELEAEMRAAGLSDFRVWPDHPRDEYHSIVFLEPLDPRNRAAMGFDMASEPVRREAMRAARMRGDVVASGRVILVQEIDEHKQAGLLLYAPVYVDHPGDALLPPAQRPLLGHAYSPLRAGDLLTGVRGRGTKLIDFEVYDGPEADVERLMHSSVGAVGDAPPRFSAAHTIEFAGRSWLLQFASRPESDALSQSWLVRWLGIGAFAASLLLASISATQARARRTAEAAARDQEAAAMALHQEREWLSGTLASIAEAVLVIDAEDRIVLMNPVAERLTGWSVTAAHGRPVSEVVDVERSPDGTIAPGEPGSGELTLRARDGSSLPIEHSSAEIRDRTGTVAGAVIVMRDVTERRQIESELRAADRRKDEFLAMLAHELRNPLAPICNALELLRRQPTGPLADNAREVATRQARHMVRLIDDLLDLSRISRGRIMLRRQPMQLATALESAIETSRPLITSRRHRLRIAGIDAALRVDGDHTRLAQVFANLLNNAANYTEPGGEITVEARREDGQARICIRDTGIGIDAEHLPHVFDMFMQANRSMERSGGLGIGLTLVRQLIQLHGGTVEVHSAGSGRGSEFLVRLPLLADAPVAEPAAEPAAPVAGSPHSLRLLVVDDNADAADSLALMLQMDGHQVEVAYDGPSALDNALADRPDAVLLDIGLPGLNGYQVARRLREQLGDRTRLIAITGWGQDSDREQARAAGFDDHLVKPIDYPLLLRMLGGEG